MLVELEYGGWELLVEGDFEAETEGGPDDPGDDASFEATSAKLVLVTGDGRRELIDILGLIEDLGGLEQLEKDACDEAADVCAAKAAEDAEDRAADEAADKAVGGLIGRWQ